MAYHSFRFHRFESLVLYSDVHGADRFGLFSDIYREVVKKKMLLYLWAVMVVLLCLVDDSIDFLKFISSRSVRFSYTHFLMHFLSIFVYSSIIQFHKLEEAD